jgi:precorrin-3B C17-methyltransferase
LSELKRVRFAISPELRVGGSNFTSDELQKVINLIGNTANIELTTLQQLIIDTKTDDGESLKQQIREIGLKVYEVGLVVKNLTGCSFCKGAEEEGLETARSLNEAIAGIPVPFTLRAGYTGCLNACGEPLTKEIGVVKNGATFDIYIGGETKGMEAKVGELYRAGVSAEELNVVITRLIGYYQNNGNRREKFSQFVERLGLDYIRQEVI